MGVDVGKTTVGTSVEVGSGVNVLRGVDVTVSVGGIAACVCMDAASAVCAIYVLIAFGSSGGTGAEAVGTHARISMSAMLQKKIFLPVFMILR